MESLTRHTDYGNVPFDESTALADPFSQFAQWLKQAEAEDIFEPNAMVLGTIDPDGSPSSRTVLLKGLDHEAFEFVTNYLSRKGRAISAHPEVTMLFPWYSLKRQVIITGRAEVTSAAVSDKYWNVRPHGAQLASAASAQSEVIESRELLDARLAELEARYPEGTPVPRPEHWGGVRVVPETIEFWQGRSMRFHDRLRYVKDADGSWKIQRLQP